MKLNVTTEQINQILNALAQQPYIEVHELIATIQQQGQAQLNEANNPNNNALNSTPRTLSEAEVKGAVQGELKTNNTQTNLAQEAIEQVTNGH